MSHTPSTSTTAIAARLAGAPNFRDIGGWRTADGRVVRLGVTFRSGDLYAATDDDLRALDALTIRLVVDLRSEQERSRRANRWHNADAPRTLILNLIGDLRAAHRGLASMLAADPTPAGARRVMLQTYRYLPDALTGVLRELFTALADNHDASLIHCTAGKDRTCFVCACLLHVLGVHRDDIYADYLLSQQRVAGRPASTTAATLIETLLGVHTSQEVVAVINGVSAEFLDAAFARVVETHGSAEGWLAASGIDASLRARLHARMLANSQCEKLGR
jgi:protein-tyrosine phosphatase